MTNRNLSRTLILSLAAIYFISQFYRASLGTLTSNIEQDFFLNPEELGRLGAVFFLAFAFTQVPLGIILDYYNPIKVIVLMLLIVYLGTIIIAFSDSYFSIVFGRFLQGIGCGVCLMGPLVFLSKNVPENKFSKTSGYVMGLGGLGALVATQPFYYLTLEFGWKKSYYITTFFIIFLIICIVCFFFKEIKLNKENKKNLNLHAYFQIILSKNFLYMLPMSFFGYASFAFLLTLWGGEYLEVELEMEKTTISKVLMFMALCWSLGSFFYGLLVNKINNKKNIVIFSALIIIFLLLILLSSTNLSFYYAVLLFGCIGFVGAFTLVVISQYRFLYSSNIIGKVLTTANFFNFLGVFFVQWTTGLIMHLSKTVVSFSYKNSFTLSFIAVVIYLLISIFFYLKIDDKPEYE